MSTETPGKDLRMWSSFSDQISDLSCDFDQLIHFEAHHFYVCSTFSDATLSSAYIYLNEILIYVMIRATL